MEAYLFISIPIILYSIYYLYSALKAVNKIQVYGKPYSWSVRRGFAFSLVVGIVTIFNALTPERLPYTLLTLPLLLVFKRWIFDEGEMELRQ